MFALDGPSTSTTARPGHVTSRMIRSKPTTVIPNTGIKLVWNSINLSSQFHN